MGAVKAMRPAMPDMDAPQVEPLTLTLEEALAKLGERGYMLAVHHHEDAPEYVLREVYSPFARGSFGHWKDAVEAALGVPVVPRDPTAELAEALERVIRGALWDDLVDRWLVQPEVMERVRAALARVKGEGEAW